VTRTRVDGSPLREDSSLPLWPKSTNRWGRLTDGPPSGRCRPGVHLGRAEVAPPGEQVQVGPVDGHRQPAIVPLRADGGAATRYRGRLAENVSGLSDEAIAIFVKQR